MFLTGAPIQPALGSRSSRLRSIAGSLLLHAVFAVGVFLFAQYGPPTSKPIVPQRQVVLLTELVAPRIPISRPPISTSSATRSNPQRPSALPSKPRRTPALLSSRARPKPSPAARPFHAARPAVAAKPSQTLILASAPNLGALSAPQAPPIQPRLALGPAPIRTGEFTQLQEPAKTLMHPPSRALAEAGFGELRAPDAAKSAALPPAAPGSFGDASAAHAQSIRLPAAAVSGFGDAWVADVSIAKDGASHSATATPRDYTPAEIQFKPVAEYTDEARRRRVEGEVLLEVLFTASGQARLLRMVRGLGFGLDEAAEAAARQIRFVPALRHGAPVDSRAIVHIQFQLAY